MSKLPAPYKGTSANILSLIALAAASHAAHALPSYARQTGQECAACHVGSFGPQLTPYGQKFKIGGYTEKGGNDAAVNIPLSAMLVGTYDRTKKDLPEDAGPHDGTNNNSSLQEASVFVAGGVTDHLGGLIQTTYSDIEHKTGLDNVDIRYAFNTNVDGSDMVVGFSLNNNPTNQDPFNSTPAWGFPYIGSELAPGPNGSPLLAGGLEQQVLGLSAYAFWDEIFYAEIGGYKTLSTAFLKKVNVAESSDDIDAIDGTAPYWRIAVVRDFNRQNFSAGLFGMAADLLPARENGPTNKYRDLGIDATYQYLGTQRNVFTVNASYIREIQKLDAAVAAEEADRQRNHTNALNINGAYYFDKTYGFSLGYFNNSGSSADMTAYEAAPLDGSRSGKPDTKGYTVQADWTPWGKEDSWMSPYANVRVGLQYTAYSQYNGSSKNYDGFGRDAKDNNTLLLFIWTAI